MKTALKRLFWTIVTTFFGDRTYLRLKYALIMGKPLNLKDPKSFTEKLNWLKLYDHNPTYTTMVDKYRVKGYVANIIGNNHIIPTLAVYDSASQIDFDQLPDQFVLKCNHDSDDGVIICTDKSSLDKEYVINKLGQAMNSNYYQITKEWPYKNVQRKIIAEEYITDPEKGDLMDYKFFCFNGNVKFFKIDFDRRSYHRANYFLPDKSLLPFGEIACPPDFSKKLDIPANLEEMMLIAEKLAEGIPFVRVDLYNASGKIYFGELTFYPASGFGPFEPAEWDNKIGELLILPQKRNNWKH